MITHLTPNTPANDARMRRALFKGVFLYVEGPSDERFYRKFLEPNECQVIICHGRPNVRDVCHILELASFKGAIGIIDADFNHLEGKSTGVSSVFQTDMHDCESFMLSTAAFDTLMLEIATPEKVKAWQSNHTPDVRRHLLQQAALVSALLWHSIRSGLRLCFDELEAKEYVVESTLTVDIPKLLGHVKNKSQRHDLPDDQLAVGIQQRLTEGADIWQLVRSHDVIDILSFALRKTLGTWKALDITPERLEQGLRLAYLEDDFSQTRLFDQIRQWEVAHIPFRVLRSISQKSLEF